MVMAADFFFLNEKPLSEHCGWAKTLIGDSFQRNSVIQVSKSS